MRIAIEGCAHGELEIIYETIQEIEKNDGKKVDLLICCGDFQSTRNLADLKCMAVPDKYKDMCTFYKYYSGEKIAPVLTIFIGGNHEASNYLQELPYGGWVAPKIYYMGYASVVTIGSIRIAGLSGIYKSQHYMQGHYERPPYTDRTIRSVYHTRNLEIFRLKQLSGDIDIMLSHDWPLGITKFGDENSLLKYKPFFRSDIENNSLGSPPCMELLEHHFPSYWFSAHLHCKFAAVVPEKNGAKRTKFLALDKCLPRRRFLQIVELEHDSDSPLELSYDLEWLTILYLTNHLLSVKSGIHYMPGEYGSGRWIYTPSQDEKSNILKKFKNNLKIPSNFTPSAKAFDPAAANLSAEPPQFLINEQTTQFCNTLGIDDPSVLLQILTNSKDTRPTVTPISTSLELILDKDNISASFEETLESPLKESLTDDSHNKTSLSNISCHTNIEDEEMEVLESHKELDESTDNSDAITKETTTDDGCSLGQVEPNCKKFKRRNYSIYASNNDVE